jgi:ubiquinol-cytochrome c reductase cytochrome b/c1 subunit
VFFAPNYLGHPDNYIPANPLVTPAHIVPEWYFLPFYAILRAVPDKLGGVLLMFGAIAMLFVLPWLDTSRCARPSFRPIYRILLLAAAGRLHRARLGRRQAAGGRVHRHRRIATAYYFLHFLVILPLLGKLERPLPLPESIPAGSAGGLAGAGAAAMEKA